MSNLVLSGVSGSNPLGFLAALGTLRLADRVWPGGRVKLRWVQRAGWNAELTGLPTDNEAGLCAALSGSGQWAPLEDFGDIGNNLTVPPEQFAATVVAIQQRTTSLDRRAADFAAAFGCEVFGDDKGRLKYTRLCFITGSGHQDFLKTAKNLAESCGGEQLREGLFGPWRYQDKSNSFRWDPGDAKEYALRWSNPGPEGVTTVWGANRLAFEALPLFPVVPTSAGPKTTGFQLRSRTEEFTWPVWNEAVNVDAVRSILGLAALQATIPNRAELNAMGLTEVFRSQWVRIGQGANFKVSFRPARAV